MTDENHHGRRLTAIDRHFPGFAALAIAGITGIVWWLRGDVLLVLGFGLIALFVAILEVEVLYRNGF